MRELQKAGKVVIAIDSDGQPDARRAYIGTNNRKAGEVAGKAAAQLRPKGGKTAVFVGTAVRRQRHASAARASSPGPGKAFEQVEVFEDGGDKQPRPGRTSRTPSPSTPTSASCSASGRTTPRGSPRRSASRPSSARRSTVVTFDLDELAVDHVEKGWIDATVCQNPYEMGYQGVRLLKALVEDDKATVSEMLPGEATSIDTGVRVIVPSKDSPVKGDNVIDIKAMKEWLDEQGPEVVLNGKAQPEPLIPALTPNRIKGRPH